MLERKMTNGEKQLKIMRMNRIPDVIIGIDSGLNCGVGVISVHNQSIIWTKTKMTSDPDSISNALNAILYDMSIIGIPNRASFTLTHIEHFTNSSSKLGSVNMGVIAGVLSTELGRRSGESVVDYINPNTWKRSWMMSKFGDWESTGKDMSVEFIERQFGVRVDDNDICDGIAIACHAYELLGLRLESLTPQGYVYYDNMVNLGLSNHRRAWNEVYQPDLSKAFNQSHPCHNRKFNLDELDDVHWHGNPARMEQQ